MKSLIAVSLLIFPASTLQAYNIGYLSSDFGFPVTVDKFQWQELELKGRTILQYNKGGTTPPGDWIGVLLITIEREHIPPPCLKRMRNEFELGVEELDLFIIKKDPSKKLLRVSTTDLPAFLVSNSVFILEYNGLYRKYGDNFVQKTTRPRLRSETIQHRIDLIQMNLNSNKPITRSRMERLLQKEAGAIIRPLTWEEIKKP